jgi:hypothetical protein
MYHVIGIGLTATILYLLSYSLHRTGFFPLQLHRKLWNILLALTFILTAIAGLFLALQASYKWDVPVVKTILKWHVEFGIGMAFTGIFHFAWHLNYFKTFFPEQGKKSEATPLPFRGMAGNLVMIGFVSSSIQLLLLREIMNISGGYELISGTFLASWLLASSMGAVLGGRSEMNDARKINLSFSVSPLISLSFLLLLARVFLHPGQTPSFLISLIYAFIVVLPFCLISGFAFVRLISIAKASELYKPGKSFSIETAGGIIAGLIITVLTSGMLNSYQIFLLITVLAIAYTLTSYIFTNKTSKLLTRIFALAAAATIILFNADVLFRQILIPGINVSDTRDTPYGNITIGSYKGEESTYYDQKLITYSGDVAEREENIHYAMLQHDNPRKVVLISGSLKSCLPEIRKYGATEITFIERDPFLSEQQELTESAGVKVKIANDDAYKYIRKMNDSTDVLIILVPPPSSLLLNRYYSKEFYHDAAKKLGHGGILLCSPGSADTYLNKEAIQLYSSIYNSLKSEFRNVLPIAGNKLYFLASDRNLSAEICELTGLRKINNIYVSPDYLSDDLIARRSAEIISCMDPGVKENRASFPVAYRSFQAYNFGKTAGEKTIYIALALLLFAIPVSTVGRKNLTMFFCAFALAGFEIILLLILQLTAGNIYQLTGVLISALMAGLATGAGINLKIMKGISLQKKIASILIFYIITGAAFKVIISLNGKAIAVLLSLMIVFIPALLTGSIFNDLTTRNQEDHEVSSTYSSDLAGSAAGFLVTATVMIPFFGLQSSIFLLSVFIFAGLLTGIIWNKQ